jgi:hypothetical protein
MRPASDETEAEFIVRVEDFRVKYGESPSTCFRNFVPQLSLEYRRQLKALSRSQLSSDLDWGQVVADAARCCEYSSLTPEDTQQTLTGF